MERSSCRRCGLLWLGRVSSASVELLADGAREVRLPWLSAGWPAWLLASPFAALGLGVVVLSVGPWSWPKDWAGWLLTLVGVPLGALVSGLWAWPVVVGVLRLLRRDVVRFEPSGIEVRVRGDGWRRSHARFERGALVSATSTPWQRGSWIVCLVHRTGAACLVATLTERAAGRLVRRLAGR